MASIVECSEAPLGPASGVDAVWLASLDGDDATPATHRRRPAATESRTRRAVTAIIPVYNERNAVAATVRELTISLERECADFEIIVVDDGSTDGTAVELSRMEGRPHVRILRNDRNRGYGYSIKRAVARAAFDMILIADADGTYPLARIGDLLAEANHADMVVGARTAANAAIPLIRRPAKWALRKLAEHLTGTPIPDLNSGFRIIKRSLIARFIPLLPDGFSLTTTITLAALTHDYRVRYVPIEYARRIGRSSIRPIRDTAGFLALTVRTMLYFAPLKIFGPLSAGLLAAALLIAVGSKLILGQLADVTSVTLAVAAFDVLAIGLLAELIEKRSPAFSAADLHPEQVTKIHRRHAISEPRALSHAELHGGTHHQPRARATAPAFAEQHQQPYAELWPRDEAETEPWSSFTFAAEPEDPTV